MIAIIMLSEKDKEKILRLRQEEDLSYEEIHKKTKFAKNTIMNICREKVEKSQKKIKESQEEAKKQEVHFDNPINKVRAIPKAIDNLIETEQLKADDRAEWEKRKEDIREILRIKVDDRIAEEREDATKISDEQWQEHIEENYEKKEVVTFLRRSIRRREAAIEGLTKSIEEGDEFTASLRDRNIDLNNDNTVLRKKIADRDDHIMVLRKKNAYLDDFIDNFLDDAGRRERSKLRSERKKIDQEREEWAEWDKERSEEQKIIDEQKINIRLKRKKITQERIEWDKKLSEEQKILEDQKHKQQTERTELKQKGDAIAAEKKDLMAFAGEIGRKLLELSKVEQKIKRNKHLSFLTADPSKRSLVL